MKKLIAFASAVALLLLSGCAGNPAAPPAEMTEPAPVSETVITETAAQAAAEPVSAPETALPAVSEIPEISAAPEITETAAVETPSDVADTEPEYMPFSEVCENAVATVVTASDFQENGCFFRFRAILDMISEAGCPVPDCALLGGDYNIDTGLDPDNNIRLISEKLTGAFPKFLPENAVFVQGNHDNASPALAQTGALDFGSFTVYVINEDDFPSGQTAEDVDNTLREIGEFFSGRLDAGDFRPVFVATHVPLHHNSRHDNEYAKYLVDLLNRYGKMLDIVVLFGHNHSDTFDDYIGGSVNYIGRGETMRVQIPGKDYTVESSNYTEITLNFTYLNYGYVGYSKNIPSKTSVNVLTVGVLQLCPDSIEVTRFTTEGEYSRCSIPLLNSTAAEKAA